MPETVEPGYVVTNGIRLHYLSSGRPTDPLVVFCHGFPQLGWSWRHQLGPVARAGYHAVALDMPGYGRSDKPDVAYDVGFLAACVAGVVPAFGKERAVLVGHDFGGAVVWPLARLHPEVVAGVVGVNMPDLPPLAVPPLDVLRSVRPERPNYIVQFQEPVAPEFFAELSIRGFLELFFRTRTTVNLAAFPDEVLDVYEAAFSPRGALTAPIDYYRNLDRNWQLMAPYADVRIEAPCLMISADGDPILTPALSAGMEDRVPDLQRVEIAECGHYTPEERPGETTAALLSYLARVPASP